MRKWIALMICLVVFLSFTNGARAGIGLAEREPQDPVAFKVLHHVSCLQFLRNGVFRSVCFNEEVEAMNRLVEKHEIAIFKNEFLKIMDKAPQGSWVSVPQFPIANEVSIRLSDGHIICAVGIGPNFEEAMKNLVAIFSSSKKMCGQ